MRFRDRWQRHGPLRRLFLRRCLTALPTLFGISLLTFALVHLAPGDVGGGHGNGALRRGVVSAEAAENLRRTYGFDLPVFFNFDIQDRGRRIQRSLGELLDPDRAALAERRLIRAGTLAWPEIFLALSRLDDPNLRVRLRRIIHRHLDLLLVPQRKSLRGAPDAALIAWWRTHASAYQPDAIRRAVDRLVRTGGPSAHAAVLAIHQRAVPLLVKRLLSDHTSEAARKRLSQALADITGHVVLYDPEAPAVERRSTLGQWRDWWRSEELVYRDLDGWERVTGAVTRTRYARWIGRLVHGDFGESSYYRRRAWDVIAERIPVTLGLNLAALLLAYLVAVPLGVFTATRRGRLADRLINGGLLLLYSLPVYWVGLMLVLYLGGLEGPAWFPAGGLHSLRPENYPAGSGLLDLLWHAVLPVFCLGYAALAVVSRYQRAGMLDVLDQEYMRTARAKGLTERRVIWRHGLRNGVLPVINLLGLQIPYLLSGSVIVETIFDIPGLGSLTLLAIHQRDTNVLMGIIALTAVLTLVGLLLADVLMLFADPRIAFEREEAS